jgi:hypothetical protein
MPVTLTLKYGANDTQVDVEKFLGYIQHLCYHVGMSRIAEKERLARDLLLLDGAHRDPDSGRRAIAMVRNDLARAVGPTITRAMAARLLGVSQTALDRWIESGEVPAVISPSGRREIARDALLALVEDVTSRRRDGDRHPLASALHAQSLEAARINRRLIGDLGPPSPGRGRAERIALAYHRVVAGRLHDELVHRAQQRISEWRSEQRIAPRYADQWEAILARTRPEIATLIAKDSETMADLRQNSPFAGALSEPERRRIIELVDSARCDETL